MATRWLLPWAALAIWADATAASPTPQAVAASPEIAIADVSFEGAEYFKDQTLRATIATRSGELASEAQLRLDCRSIARLYRERGFLEARVRYRLHAVGAQVAVTFEIQPGARAKVRHVLVQGNVALTDAEALEGAFTQPDQIFGVFKQAGVFHAGRLDNDLRAVARNYYRRGYLEAAVLGWRARALPAAEAVDVVIDVREGPLYRMGPLELRGDLPDSPEALQALIHPALGEVADVVALGESLEQVLDLWRARGFPFPQVQQAPRLDQRRHLYLSAISVIRGSEARIGQVHIQGEPWTGPRVFARAMAMAPGDLYDIEALRRTEQRLLGTGLFMEAHVTPLATADPAVVDVQIAVVERPGIVKDCVFNIAPAYLQYEGLIGIGLLMCPNTLGQGVRTTALVQLSELRRLFDVSVVEPRLLDSDLSLSLGAHNRRLFYPVFSTSTLGASAGLNLPLPFDLGLGLSYALDRLDADPAAGLEALTATRRFPHGARRSALTLQLAYDTRVGGLQTRAGSYLGVSLSTGGFWTLGEISFVELRGTARTYLPLVYDVLLKLSLSAATVFDPTGQPVVVTERYFPGGFGSVRGYLPRSLGPTRRLGNAGDPSAATIDVPLGGVHEVVGNVELELPLIKAWDVKGFVFIDAGNAFDETEAFMLVDSWHDAREIPLPLGLYSSVGCGVLLPTGVLPLRFEWSAPLTRRPGDREVDFFFGIGGMF